MSIQNPPPVAPPGPPASPPPGYRDANAQAKAAKAYAKAQRPWFKKKRFLVLIALAVVIAIAVLTQGSGTKSPPSSLPPATAATTAATTAPATTAPATTAPATTAPATTAPAAAAGAALPIQNGDWRLDSIRVKDDGLGDFGGVARVTYTGSDTAGGNNVFTLTVFKGHTDIAVLLGSANSVAPGKAVTVQFISSDKFVNGPYTYDFQNDL